MLFLAVLTPLISGIRFGSPDSKIEMAPGATFLPTIDSLSIENGTASLGAVSGTILLSKTEGSDFKLSAASAARITMSNASIIEQYPAALTLKSTDSLIVYGDNNVFVITDKMTFNGTLQVADSAHLIIKFSDDYLNPSLTLNPVVPITVGSGAVLEFQGNGVIEATDGTQFALTGSNAQQAAAILALSTEAELNLQDSATVTIKGKGSVICTDHGGIALLNKSNLIFGDATTDSLAVVIEPNGFIRTVITDETVTATDKASISFAKGTYSLDIENSGLLHIGSHGVVEFNLLNGTVVNARCTSLNCSPLGQLELKLGGKMAFAPNSISAKVEPTLTWNSLNAQISGNGSVELYDKTTSLFTAVISTLSSSLLFKDTAATMRTIARTLAQTNASLLTTVAFADPSGTNGALSRRDKKVALSVTQTVIKDDILGNFTVRDSKTGGISLYDSLGNKK